LTFHLLGWLAERVEVYVLLKLLQLSATAAVAIGIAALSSAVRAASFVIPASLGIQEGGNIFIFSSFGLLADAAMAFSILRRMRELGWSAIGFLLLSWFDMERPRRRTSARAALPRHRGGYLERVSLDPSR
jgi:glycosyltransferase 2 family protein